MMQSGKTNIAECFNLIRNATETVKKYNQIRKFSLRTFQLAALNSSSQSGKLRIVKMET
jgi:hypothetical protein